MEPKRVLVADDNIYMARSLKMVLELWDLQATVVHSGPAAVEAARATRPDAVLLDLTLPGMDGWQVARQIRATPELAGVLLLAMSGHVDKQSRAKSLAAGFDQHLAKPLDLDSLRALLVPAAAPPSDLPRDPAR